MVPDVDEMIILPPSPALPLLPMLPLRRRGRSFLHYRRPLTSRHVVHFAAGHDDDAGAGHIAAIAHDRDVAAFAAAAVVADVAAVAALGNGAAGFRMPSVAAPPLPLTALSSDTSPPRAAMESTVAGNRIFAFIDREGSWDVERDVATFAAGAGDHSTTVAAVATVAAAVATAVAAVTGGTLIARYDRPDSRRERMRTVVAAIGQQGTGRSDLQTQSGDLDRAAIAAAAPVACPTAVAAVAGRSLGPIRCRRFRLCRYRCLLRHRRR